jgi:hypothetical protein
LRLIFLIRAAKVRKSWKERFGGILREANLRGGRFLRDHFVERRFKCCKNLDAINHGGPSTIDIRTLQRSDPLPLVFLGQLKTLRPGKTAKDSLPAPNKHGLSGGLPSFDYRTP